MGRRELRTVANAIDWFAVVLGAERRAEEFQQLCLSGGGRGVRECVDFARARVRVRAGERACGRAACVCVRALLTHRAAGGWRDGSVRRKIACELEVEYARPMYRVVGKEGRGRLCRRRSTAPDLRANAFVRPMNRR